MQRNLLFMGVAVLGAFLILTSTTVRQTHAQGNQPSDFVPPLIFQAAGTTADSIQSTVDAYRDALGANNGPTPPQVPLTSGRREINWDGAGAPNNVNTDVAGNPFTNFQASRGALFTTPDGTGFVQAPPAGLAGANVFNNPSYETIFKAFSLSRLFSAIGSNITDVTFFEPGLNNGDKRATVTGFGSVFTDVDKPDGGGEGKRHASSTLMEYFDADGDLLFSISVPASPGDGSFSFLGIVFKDARIARVRITSGNATPGADDNSKNGKVDVVMMDDFIYGEPQLIK
jgi:hypothetical protein